MTKTRPSASTARQYFRGLLQTERRNMERMEQTVPVRVSALTGMTNQSDIADVQIAILVVAIVSTAVCTALLFVLLGVLRRTRSGAIRVLAVLATITVIVSSAGFVEAGVSALNRTSGVGRLMVDPGWMMKLAPGLVAAVVAWSLRRRFSRERPIRASMTRGR